jgi:glycosyltransferase involved in cell wall biosynthesis
MERPTYVLITAFNEQERVAETIDGARRAFPGAEVWVVDDGSTDATAPLAAVAGAHLLGGERRRGKGQAASLGAQALLEHAAQTPRAMDAVAVWCDGDLGRSAAGLGPLAEAVRTGEADLAIALFKRSPGGGVGLVLAFARWAIERATGMRMEAPISGQRALMVGRLGEVAPFGAGFGMEALMTIDAARAGWRIVEVELDLEHRHTGWTLGGFVHRARQLVDIARACARDGHRSRIVSSR